MASVVKNALKSIKEKGLVNFFRHLREEGYLNLTDGNLIQTKIHNIGATLKGVDKSGNKYYENLNVQYGRHRWVEYASKNRYNASQVPPEWHGWLHFITDRTGDEPLMLKPKRYGMEHKENLSGEGDQYIYHSKGSTLGKGIGPDMNLGNLPSLNLSVPELAPNKFLRSSAGVSEFVIWIFVRNFIFFHVALERKSEVLLLESSFLSSSYNKLPIIPMHMDS